MKNIICFSHLRWTPEYGRPQRLMSRFSRESLVFYAKVSQDMQERIWEATWREMNSRLEHV